MLIHLEAIIYTKSIQKPNHTHGRCGVDAAHRGHKGGIGRDGLGGNESRDCEI